MTTRRKFFELVQHDDGASLIVADGPTHASTSEYIVTIDIHTLRVRSYGRNGTDLDDVTFEHINQATMYFGALCEQAFGLPLAGARLGCQAAEARARIAANKGES